MDITFDIQTDKGDQIMVALSYYDTETLQTFTHDPVTLTLTFYDVTLVRPLILPLLFSFSTALFVFFAAAAGTRVIGINLRLVDNSGRPLLFLIKLF